MRFEVEYPDGRAEQIDLFEKVVRIGRGSSCELQIKADGISREHVKVEMKRGLYFITDLNSSNGTKLQGEKIAQAQEVEWQTIFPIEIGAGIKVSLLPDEGVIDEKTKVQKKKRIDEDLTSISKKPKKQSESTANDPELDNIAFADEEQKPKGNLKLQLLVFLIILAAVVFVFSNPDFIKQFISI